MSNHDSRLAATQQPAQQPAPPTDRPTATYPTALSYPHPDPALPGGWRVDPRPSRYLDPADPADAPHLAEADATPTGMFPTRRSIRLRPLHESPSQRGGAARPQHEGGLAADAASLSHGGAGARVVYHTDRQAPRPATSQPEQGTPIQDMGRPGILSRPSMRWHPSLMQLVIGAALVAALLGACNVAAINAHRTARGYCHALVSSDWDRAQRECRPAGSGTPVPERLPSSPHTPSESPSQAPSPSTPPALTRVTSPSPSTQPSPAAQAAPASSPAWVTSDTHAPYDRTDPSASPLDLPRCTTRSGTSPDPSDALPCLASLSADGSRAVVLEEDASLTGLVRR